MNTETPIVSFVVPVYNSASYLTQTLTSIQNQTETCWECICVDDGSSDSSLSIIKDFASLDSRFIVISQENKGVSAARNRGLQQARGEWVNFVDSDDIVEKDMIESLSLYLQKKDLCDLIVCGMIDDIYDGNVLVRSTEVDYLWNDIKIVNQNQRSAALSLMINSKSLVSNLLESSCNKFFKRDLIERHKIRLHESMHVYEDLHFVLNYIQRTKNGILLYPRAWYHYRLLRGQSSAERHSDSDYLSDIDRVLEAGASLLSKLAPISAELKTKLDVYFISKLALPLMAGARKLPLFARWRYYGELRKRPICRHWRDQFVPNNRRIALMNLLIAWRLYPLADLIMYSKIL